MNSKTLRYYYWLFLEFTKKHSKMMLLSFLLSFFLIFALVSFSPYLDGLFFAKKDVVGIVGLHDVNNLPDQITKKVSYGLVYIDSKGKIGPALADSWEVKNEGKEFTFHLKDKLLWDDGRDFTAFDLKYNFKDVNFKVIDKKTIVFTLKKELAIFPTYLAKPIIRYPLHGVIGEYKAAKIRYRQGNVSQINLTPNKKDLPQLEYRLYDSENKMISAYKAGEIREMNILNKSTADGFKKWKNTTVSQNVDYQKIMTLFLNTKGKLFSEKELREIVSLAIPWDKIEEYGVIANSPIPPTSWAYNPDLKKPVYDPDTATKTIKKTFPKGISLSVITFYDYLPIASILEKGFNAINIKTSVNLSNQGVPDDFDALLAYWEPPLDPDQYFLWHSTQAQGNITNYKNVKIDKLLEDGRNNINVEERKKHYFQFQKVIIDEVPAIFIFHPYSYSIKRK